MEYSNCEDFAAVVEHLVGRYHRERAHALRQEDHDLLDGGRPTTPLYSRPEPMIVAVGISLGGMILCHYLCEQNTIASQRLTAAVGVSVPYNVFLGTDNLERPLLNYLLNNHLARCLSRSVEDLSPMLSSSDVWDYKKVIKSKTIREFDSRFTAVQFGFPDVNAYYERASLHDKMHDVTVPYLGLSSQDDPFQPKAGVCMLCCVALCMCILSCVMDRAAIGRSACLRTRGAVPDVTRRPCWISGGGSGGQLGGTPPTAGPDRRQEVPTPPSGGHSLMPLTRHSLMPLTRHS
ncbi:Alpha/Beta hydrolase fold, partial [Trinorchestia longiramus]